MWWFVLGSLPWVASVHDKKVDFLGDFSYSEEQGSSEKYLSFGIGGSVSVSQDDWSCQSFSGDSILSNKSPVNAGDICSTVYFGSGVDDLKSLFIREEGDSNLHRLSRR